MPDSDEGQGTRPQTGRADGPAQGPAATPEARLSNPGRWGDLGLRFTSALVIIAVAVVTLWLGGLAWTALVTVIAVLMGWELSRLCDPAIARRKSVILAASIAPPILFLAISFLAGMEMETIRKFQYASWPVMLIAPAVGYALLTDGKWIWVAYGFVIQFGAQFFLFTGLDPWSRMWLFAIVAIVILSDTLGYFAGRYFGGPKFWPRISPKKTWSGTVAGWIGAAVFGAIYMSDETTFTGSILLGALTAASIAFAGQMGDIAASAIKRRVGVKDASNLIPGHGGFMDRLDAMLAAAAATIIWALVF